MKPSSWDGEGVARGIPTNDERQTADDTLGGTPKLLDPVDLRFSRQRLITNNFLPDAEDRSRLQVERFTRCQLDVNAVQAALIADRDFAAAQGERGVSWAQVAITRKNRSRVPSHSYSG